jgi:hypothetical protein
MSQCSNPDCENGQESVIVGHRQATSGLGGTWEEIWGYRTCGECGGSGEVETEIEGNEAL